MTDHHSIENSGRREFLIRCGKAGLTITAACGLSYWCYDGNSPEKPSRRDDSVKLPDFSIPGIKKKMCIVRGTNRETTIQKAFKTLGGIDAFVKPGDRVMLKVNAAFASPPALSATSHPILVQEVARLCFHAGAEDVIVTDNPINDPSSCFILSGIKKAAESAGARVILPRDSFFRPTSVESGKLIKNWPLLYDPFKNINKVIGLAPVKDHHRSGASMSLKNWYGLLGGRRNIFHQDIHNTIKELALMIKPTLVILDGTVSMMANGPTGGSLSDLKPTRTMIVSTDPVAADAFGATLLGKTLNDLPFISKAADAGAGTADYESLEPVIIKADENK